MPSLYTTQSKQFSVLNMTGTVLGSPLYLSNQNFGYCVVIIVSGSRDSMLAFEYPTAGSILIVVSGFFSVRGRTSSVPSVEWEVNRGPM